VGDADGFLANSVAFTCRIVDSQWRPESKILTHVALNFLSFQIDAAVDA
jgi:hypothetical protein